MKKTKISQIFMLVISTSLLTVGCSNEKSENEDVSPDLSYSEALRPDLSYEESEKIEREGTLSITDNTYFIFKDKKSRKFENREFSYNIINNLKPELKNEFKNEDDTIVVYNSSDNSETLTFFNIETLSDNMISFSVLGSNGAVINDVFFELNENISDKGLSSKLACLPCWEKVLSVGVDLLVDALSSSGSGGLDMTQVCLAQIQACFASGGTPTDMQSSSSWYGGTSCSLTCIPN